MTEPEQPTEAAAASDAVENPEEAPARTAPWYADPFFMAGVATSVAVVLYLAIRPKRECADCRKHREAAEQLAAAGIVTEPGPEPGPRTPAQPVQTPGPGVAPVPTMPEPVVLDDELDRYATEPHPAPAPAAPSLPTLPQPGAPGLAGPVGVLVPAGDGPRCTVVEWCALPDSHPGAHLAAARPAMTGDELAAAALEAHGLAGAES